jgi:tRNA-dihydrouridine synthase B
MQIADLTLETPFIAAPMAGVTNPAFRLMARRGGASLVYTEMISAVGLVKSQPKTLAMTRVEPEERPACLQLFGSDPKVMGRAAAIASLLHVDLLDINMGCPARKVRRQGSGSKLLETPELALEVVQAVVENSKVPVTVKVRLGQYKNNLKEFLPPILETGVKAVCLHARTTDQAFSGQADWQAIRELVSWCPLPVIGNGDVKTPYDAVNMLNQTGCAAVMIGRAALGDPWIFDHAQEVLTGGEPQDVSIAQRKQALLEHMDLARQKGGEGHAVHFVKQFMMWYTRGLPGAVNFRRTAGPSTDMDELWRHTEDFFANLEDLQS